MKRGLYVRMAKDGIFKNRKLYLPYLITCGCMVMIYYIISFLATNETVKGMRGGDTIQGFLIFGSGVIFVFSLIFLFYTNSFLMRRRKREFGLYNVLGMGKFHLFRVMCWESLIAGVVALAGGLFCGILFSKLSELCIAFMMESEGSLRFVISWKCVWETILRFAVIFFLMLLSSVRQIYKAKPVEMLSSEAVGEKPPKANWVGAVLGVLLLGGAYYLAVVTDNPISAIMVFFLAVIMVIVATYLLFIAGSVTLCRLLQKNKRYYYKTNHFVSVSSMAYRMKRNGAGLASICILATMVLVMVSSTACLFLGKEVNLRERYPRNIIFHTYSAEESYAQQARQAAAAVVEKHGLPQEQTLHYRFLAVAGYQWDNKILLDAEKIDNGMNYANVYQLFFIPLEDYNQLTGASETLEEGEALLYVSKGAKYAYDDVEIESVGVYGVKKQVEKFVSNGTDSMQIFPSMFLVVQDMDEMLAIVDSRGLTYQEMQSWIQDYCGFDLNCGYDEMQQVYQEIENEIAQLRIGDENFPMVIIECMAHEREGFYGLYGGLFFLGIILAMVFIFAAVLIIYYKQISEGYEDQGRFAIMQKVGMTKKEIKKSINSQVLTVFFLPLLMAGLHVAFAFAIIRRLLLLFGLFDLNLLIGITVGCYLVFALFYVLVYKFTSRAYYKLCA